MKRMLIAAAVAACVPLAWVSTAPAAQAKTPAECQALLGVPGVAGPAAPGSYEKCLAMPEDRTVPGVIPPNPGNLPACIAAKRLGGDVHGMC